MANNLKNKSFLKKLSKIGAGLFSVSRHSSRLQKGRGFWRTENKFYALLAVIILLAVFVPQHQVAAAWYNPVSWATDMASYLGGKVLDLTVGNLIAAISSFVIALIGSAIGWAASLLDGFISFQTNNAIYDIAVVNGSWAIIRNFVNLLFILVLIVMAFGTIFNIQRYTWKNMLAPFLIAALLINFSLAIGQYIITIANGLSKVFLTEIQGAAAGGISATFAKGADIAGGVTISSAAGLYVQAMFSIVFLGIFLLALLATALFSLVRMFMLWFLLIISPIAWFGYTMPNLRSGTWSVWWKHFLCWCFWLPYFLFFVMFAVIFINSSGTLPMPPGFMSTVGNSVAFFVLSILFLVGGMGIAHKLACASGTGVKAVFGKIETGVRKYAPGAAYVRAGYTGAKEGLAAKGAEISERGLPIGFGRRFGGEQAERLRTARVAERFGFGAKAGEAGRVQMAEVEKEAKRVRELLIRTPADDQKKFLQDQKAKGGLVAQAAELEFVKQGYSSLKDYQDATKKFGGENSAFMRQYLENLNQAKNSALYQSQDEELRIARGGDKGEYIDLVNLRRQLYKDLAKRDRVNNLEDYNQAKKLLSPIPAELRSFLDSVKAESVFTTREQRQDALLDSKNKVGDSDLEKKLVEFMKEKKEIAEYRKKDTKELIAAGWQLREKALEILGGKETFGGKGLIKEINNQNPVINIEATIRMDQAQKLGLDYNEKADREKIAKLILDNEELIGKIQEELKGKSYTDIRKMSGKFFEDPAAQEAIKRMYDPKEISDLIKNSSQEMRRALKDFAASEEKTKRRRS